MKRKEPIFPAVLEETRRLADGFASGRLSGAKFCGQSIAEETGEEWSVNGCVFERCRFTGARLEKSEWTDVAFVGCELSGVDWSGSFFERCRFVDCKLSGSNWFAAGLQDVTFSGCAAPDADFRQTRWKRAELTGCTLARALLGESVLTGWTVRDCDLSGVNCFKTALKGIDFTGCTIDGLQVVGPELQGAIVDAAQAAQLARLLGVVVRG